MSLEPQRGTDFLDLQCPGCNKGLSVVEYPQVDALGCVHCGKILLTKEAAEGGLSLREAISLLKRGLK